MYSSSRFLRSALVASLIIPAIVIVLAGTSHAQIRPGGPKMPMGPKGPMGSKIEKVWTCGACGKEIGKGNFPPATCPFCGIKILNGVDTPGTPNTPPQPQQQPPATMPQPGAAPAQPPAVSAPDGRGTNPNDAPKPVAQMPRPVERPAESSGSNVIGIVFGAVIALAGLVLLGFSSFCIVKNMA